MTELLTPIRNGTSAAEEPPVTATLTPHAASEHTSVAHRRVLVVVDAACTSPELCASVRAYTGNDAIEALVIAPAHGSAATQWYVDEEAARADATHRVRACIACLAQDGIRARVQLADPDPLQAIADALHEFPADEILIVTAPQRPSTWLHPNVVDRARRSFQQPIEHLVMPTTPVRRSP